MTMPRRPLGRTGLTASQICLGTMTYGTQNTEAEGHRQMDRALERGVDFFDTAEAYSAVPMGAQTQGRTEEFIGTWFKSRGTRDKVILATKIAGRGISYIRDGGPITGKGIEEAVEGSLRRLQTDYIDLYQLHWPNRGHYHFRRQWSYDPSGQSTSEMADHVEDTLEALGRLVAAGKIRAIGLSNETCWGTMQYLQLAEARGLPRVATVQNEYSLLYRNYDLDMAEMSHHEDVGLFAYSPLAAGLLSGKYSGGARPEGSRATISTTLGDRLTPLAVEASDAYVSLAQSHGLDPSAMAIAFCLTRPFMASAIIGATKDDQLDIALSAADLTLGEDVMTGIAELHARYPQPF